MFSYEIMKSKNIFFRYKSLTLGLEANANATIKYFMVC